MNMRNLLTKDIWLSCWLGCGILAVAATLMPIGGHTPGGAWQFDKIARFLGFVLLIAIPLAKFPSRRGAFFCTALIPAMGISLEYLQKYINGRGFIPEDMLANNIGVLVGIGIGCFFRLRTRLHRQTGKA
jgi:VanZ family protein